MNSTANVELVAMRDLPKYRVCKDNVDPRGWNIVDSNGVPVGTASDLIIDLLALIARYIVCSTSRGDPRDVLLPTGFARLEDGDQTVYLDFVTAMDIEGLPAYTGLPLSDGVSARIEEALTGATHSAAVEAKVVEAKIVRRNS